jgi:fumarate reductase flavoprotein subunit
MEKSPRGHATAGGEAIVSALGGRLSGRERFDSAVSSRVDRLIVEDGVVCGVGVGGAEVRAGAVVLAMGGMGANPDMLSQWHPESFWGAQGPLVYLGWEHARGDIIQFGLQAGAQIVRGRGIRNPVCVFLTGYWPRFCVVVNQLGRRFLDETVAYAVAELLVPQQPGGVAYLLFDDAIKQSLRTRSDIDRHIKVELIGDQRQLWRSEAIDDLVARGEVTKAATIEDLARRLGIPPANLRGTLDRYNAQVETAGDADFFKAGGDLPPLKTGPFYAAKITQPFYAFTGTGVRVDERAAVLHETSRAIPGLFAAGECVGNVLGGIYFGSGNSLASCAVFGRAAGESAATRAMSLG